MNASWPDLTPATWAPTKRTLHAVSQMLGKLRLALAPAQPNFFHTALALSARGFTTGCIPVQWRTLEASVDLFAARLLLATSDGAEHAIALGGTRTVADIWSDLHAALRALRIDVSLSPLPQEVADTTPFDTDIRPAPFEPDAAGRWHTAVTATHTIFDRWREHFFGRSGLMLWWGGFDYTLLLFNGKHVDAPRDAGYLRRYDLDAEMLAVGFFPGADESPPIFYGYLYPQPPNVTAVPIAPASAAWASGSGEWILPYDALRASVDPEAELRAFLDALYAIGRDSGGWDLRGLSYVAPPLRRAR